MDNNEKIEVCQEKYGKTKQYSQDLIIGYKMCVVCDKNKELSNFRLFCSSKTHCLSLICNDCDSKGFKPQMAKDIDTRRGWKLCSKCNKQKELINFLIDSRFDVYTCQCKECGKLKTNKNRNLRRKNSINYRIRQRLAGAIRGVLIGKSKSAKTMELIGCNLEQLIQYLTTKFIIGMNWENYGYGAEKWHIDHILPTALFDMTIEKHQKFAFGYKNLQPLWQHDNVTKSDRLENGRFAQDLSPEEKKDYLISIGLKYLFD